MDLEDVRATLAAGRDADEADLRAAVVESVGLLARRLLLSDDEHDNPVVLIAAQALANLVTGNEETQARLWAALVQDDSVLSDLVVGGGHKVVAVVAYLVNACIRANEQRLQSMTTGKGAHLFQVLLRGAERFSEDDSEDAFEMIYEVSTVVAMNTDILRAVVTELQAHLLVGELLTLLRFVDAAQGRVPASSLAALVPTLEWLINLGDASVVSEQILKRAQEGASLLVQTFADRAGEDDESVRVALCDAGVVAPVVRLLRHVHKEAPPLAPSVQVDQDTEHLGVKKELVRLLTNLSHRNRVAQDQMRTLEGLHLLLDMCRLDNRNPYIREWAIFGLRNLCEGNLENQDVIRSLEARGAADQQTLRELGLESEVGKDGRLKVRSTGSPLARQQNESD